MYCIRPDYNHRLTVPDYNDLVNRNEAHQKEVYQHVASEMEKEKYLSIIDIGCGSGYKLVKYFSMYNTTGLELPKAVHQLQKWYPKHSWLYSNPEEFPLLQSDVVLCSDVIEHIENPFYFLTKMGEINARAFYLSTPDRALLYETSHKGPPANPHHFREWNVDEFKEFLSLVFNVEYVIITNLQQGTILAKCVKK